MFYELQTDWNLKPNSLKTTHDINMWSLDEIFLIFWRTNHPNNVPVIRDDTRNIQNFNILLPDKSGPVKDIVPQSSKIFKSWLDWLFH
jgi:hypothetical protein